MALGAATVWEVRTTGSNNNGGGFDSGVAVPGTDFSQQDSAEDSGTDLTCVDGDAAAPVIASASHNFVAADEGNIINITEAGTGFTVGRYLIVDTSVNTATLDRACGANGALTGGDWYLGGAVLTIDTAVTDCVAGNKIWVKAGTYGEYVNCSDDDSSAGKTIVMEGYNATRGDKPTGTNRPYIDAANTRATALSAGLGWIYKYMRFGRGTGQNITGDTNGCLFIFCKDGTGSYSDMRNCFGCETTGFSNEGMGGGNPTFFIGSYSHDNSGIAIAKNANGDYKVFVINSIVDTNGSVGISHGTSSLIINSTIYNNTGDGCNGQSNYNQCIMMFLNNIIHSNGGYGLDAGAASGNEQAFIDFCSSYNNTTAAYRGYTTGDNNITADPLLNAPATADFTLQAGSPALNTGYPATTCGETATV